MYHKWICCFLLSAALCLAACDDDAPNDGGAQDTSSGADAEDTSAPDTSGTSGADTSGTSGADTSGTSGADTSGTSGADTSDTSDDGDATDPPGLPSYCLAVRGNGELVFAHFASMARVVEHYGLPRGVAGGSAASLSSFILESVALNPGVQTCGGQPCDAARAGERAGFLLKSLPAYAAFLGATDEGQAFTQLAPVIAQAVELGIEDLISSDDLAGARDALVTLLSSPDIADLL
jgi:hypothetical protein